jgi:hypothetical protein
MRPRTGSLMAISLGVFLLLSHFATEMRAWQAAAPAAAPAQKSPPANAAASATVRAAIRNVDFHLTDRIIVHIVTLDGSLVPTEQGQIPVFDDKKSFGIAVDSASMTLSTTALTNDLNDYVFARSDAPLKKLSASIKGDELTVKGLLVSKGGVPFASTGTVSVTPDGQVRVHTTKVKGAGIPVKGLMDLLGIDTANLLSTKKVEGLSVDKDDLILDPQTILPPPQIHGTLVAIELKNGEIALRFDSGHKSAPIASTCGGRNFLAFKGGSVRFGKLTMSDTDLELLDNEPADPFDFSIDHYAEQLSAGYAKVTLKSGLCAHIPDFSKLKRK